MNSELNLQFKNVGNALTNNLHITQGELVDEVVDASQGIQNSGLRISIDNMANARPLTARANVQLTGAQLVDEILDSLFVAGGKPIDISLNDVANVRCHTAGANRLTFEPDFGYNWELGRQGESCSSACARIGNTSCVEGINGYAFEDTDWADFGVRCNGLVNWDYNAGPGQCTRSSCCRGDCVGVCTNPSSKIICRTVLDEYRRVCPCREKQAENSELMDAVLDISTRPPSAVQPSITTRLTDSGNAWVRSGNFANVAKSPLIKPPMIDGTTPGFGWYQNVAYTQTRSGTRSDECR